jgi:probable HAF family extracellular repeat protein
MRRTKMRTSSALKAVKIIGLVLLCRPALAEKNYVAIDLGVMGESSEPIDNATSINEGGQIVGFYGDIGGNSIAFSWTLEKGVQSIGTLGGPYSIAYSQNEMGQVVGTSGANDGYQRAFVWSETEGIVELDALGNYSAATGINNQGVVVGWYSASGNGSGVFIWTKEDGARDIGSLGGGSCIIEPGALNDNGQVAGSCTTSVGETHPFIWSQQLGMVDLGTLGGSYSVANAINATGQVVGCSYTSNNEIHAFSWSPLTGMIDLGDADYPSSCAIDVSSGGQVVGYEQDANGSKVFSWTIDGGKKEVAGYGSTVIAVSDSGEVVGSHLAENGEIHAFSWDELNGLTDLGALGGIGSYATGVNSSGDITGAWTDGQTWRAVLWRATKGKDIKAAILPPVNENGDSVFQRKRVIPVKFNLALGSTPTCDLPVAKISLSKITGADTVAVNETQYSRLEDSGPVFRIEDCKYHYNLPTGNLDQGAYRVNISVAEQIVGSAIFSLK